MTIQPYRRFKPAASVLVAGLAAVPLVLAAQQHGVTREDAARLRDKVDAITRHAASVSGASLVTQVTEQEVNAYLAFDAGEQLPAGLTEPRISILGEGRLVGTAVVDLDAVRQQRKSRGWLDPLNYLGGRVGISVAGTLNASGGLARFDLDSAKLAGVSVPKVVVQELVTYYSRSESNPNGLNLDDPYPLPARIQQIEVRRGEALVKQ